MNNFLIVIAGPTAIGKTDLAITLARRLDTVILSSDSRQFYRQTSIGTAKPSGEELKAVPHYFINSLDITDNYSVGSFERDALQLLDTQFKQHGAVLMVGGSGLYIRAVCEGLDEFPAISEDIRMQINLKFKVEGITYLQETLRQLDPDYYAIVDTNNPHRMIRALEICMGTGQTFSSFWTRSATERPFKCIKIALNTDRAALYERINKRVDKMMELGLEAEARELYPQKELNALQTVGYQELFGYFDGIHTLTEAVELIKRNTRRYAKRQLTWLRKDPDFLWFEPTDVEGIWQRIKEIMEI
ncbi:MAG: tRNA (adenosine(37)-N6)-dimethylallyltransferase MiaA [Chitinophagales bacterium]|jgi:tRNA dimethylallyltransferase|nr:tRNA (adenosine(37)-N6)-dimethylallyltransferase MiaA [Chitinophagales bacterium]